MKGILFCIIFFCLFNCKAIDYVTVIDDCPIVTFTSTTLKRVSVSREYVKVQMTSDKVVVTIISEGFQTFTWNAAQADAYGYTVDGLYNYILSLITNPC